MQALEKQSDREQILREQEMRRQQEEQAKEMERMRRQMVGDQQKWAIDLKSKSLADEKRAEF